MLKWGEGFFLEQVQKASMNSDYHFHFEVDIDEITHQSSMIVPVVNDMVMTRSSIGRLHVVMYLWFFRVAGKETACSTPFFRKCRRRPAQVVAVSLVGIAVALCSVEHQRARGSAGRASVGPFRVSVFAFCLWRQKLVHQIRSQPRMPSHTESNVSSLQ